MKQIYFAPFLMLLLLVHGCCNSKPTTEKTGQDKIINHSGPTSIVQNLSIVTARVDEVLFKDETDYQLRVTVLAVKDSNSLNSIAVAGNTYLLTPNFRYDNDKLMNNDINEALKKLGKLSQGDEFKAEISLENNKGWFIQKVLSFE